MFGTAADPAYRRDLGAGLVERWSTRDDVEKIALLASMVFRDAEEDAPNPRAAEAVRRQMSGDYPLMGPGDYALVEDTSKEGCPVVASTCLWRQTWEYEGIPFGVGQPEYVMTDSAYRHRGLIRSLFAMLHARSEAEGHLVQAITGISYFYRQFGYEYALELEGRRVAYLDRVPSIPEGTPEPYTLRAATPEDIPRIMELYNQRRAESMVWPQAPENFWRYQLAESASPNLTGKQACVRLLVDAAGTTLGYLIVATRRWEKELPVWAVDIAPGVNWQEVLFPLLRALQRYGEQIPAMSPEAEQLRGISFILRGAHPIYEVLGQQIAPLVEAPYAWYVRVPDLLAFLRLIAPVLEKRLAASPAAYYSGELKLDLYRSGLRLVFERGRLAQLEPWRAPLYKNNFDVQCPPLVFLQLLFGYRSLDELRAAFPDVQAPGHADLLLRALFPKKVSWMMAAVD